MSRIILLPLCLLLLFAQCKDYDSATVGIRISAPKEFKFQLDLFSKHLNERLKAFSEENKDFTVTSPDSTGRFNPPPTALINIRLTSIKVVGYEKYKTTVAHNDSILDKIPKFFVYFFPGIGPSGMESYLTEKISSSITSTIAKNVLEEADHPSMKYYVEVFDIKNREVLWQDEDSIDYYDGVPIQVGEQLSALLSIFRGRLDDKLPFFQLH